MDVSDGAREHPPFAPGSGSSALPRREWGCRRARSRPAAGPLSRLPRDQARVSLATRPVSQHAVKWPGAASTRGGDSSRQRPVTSPHRSAKRQPRRTAPGSGTNPGNLPETHPVLERLPVGRDARHRREQPQRVRMSRRAEQVRDRSLFDLAPGVHDDHSMGHFRDDAEVVGDQDHGRFRAAREARS